MEDNENYYSDTARLLQLETTPPNKKMRGNSTHHYSNFQTPKSHNKSKSNATNANATNTNHRNPLTPKPSPITQGPLVFSIGTTKAKAGTTATGRIQYSNNKKDKCSNNNYHTHRTTTMMENNRSNNNNTACNYGNPPPPPTTQHIMAIRNNANASISKRALFGYTAAQKLILPHPDHDPIQPIEKQKPTKLIQLILDKKWGAVKQRCLKKPSEAAIWLVKRYSNNNNTSNSSSNSSSNNNKGEIYSRHLAIHLACRENSSDANPMPRDVLDCLIAVHPEGLVAKGDDGKYPLHVACANASASARARHDMISILVKANVHTLKVKAEQAGGDLPLHMVCQHANVYPETIKIMLDAYPESALVTGAMERLALQMVCASGARLSVVQMLLNGNPDAVYWKDSFDALALHLACKNSSEEVCLFLLGAYIYGAQIGDCWDKLPLHYACDQGTSEALVRALLKKYPESIHCKDSTDKTPLDLARDSASSRKDKILKILSDHVAMMSSSSKEKGDEQQPATNNNLNLGRDEASKSKQETSAVPKPTHDLVDGVKAEFQNEIKEVRSELNDVKGMLNKILMIMGEKKSNGEEVV